MGLADLEGSVVLAVALEDGSVVGLRVDPRDGAVVPAEVGGPLPSGAPPVLTQLDRPTLLAPPADAAPLTQPLLLSGVWIYVARDGALVLGVNGAPAERRLALDALPDARPIALPEGRVGVLTGPTDAYPHGALGDSLEATRIAVVDPGTGGTSAFPVDPEGKGWVAEALAPLLADVEPDGIPELLLTRSRPGEGAQIALFSPDGRLLGTGPSLGRTFRWRHLLAVAPFGPRGEVEVAEVLTPHLGGVLQFSRWDGRTLVPVARLEGVSTHRFGSPNLETAVAADLDGDGAVELALPDGTFRRILVVRRTDGGVAVIRTLDLPAPLATNLALVPVAEGQGLLAVGLEDGRLLVWTALCGEDRNEPACGGPSP